MTNIQYSFVSIIDSQFSGNGGYSLRRVSVIQEILKSETRETIESESKWFAKRILNSPNTRTATPQTQAAFVVESTWHPTPMGFHLPNGGSILPKAVWKDNDNWKDIYAYCPETKIIMPMKFERQICPLP